MKYRVIKEFTDLQDDSHKYKVGDKFPRDGKTVTDARIEKLSSNANRQGTPLIVMENNNGLNSALPVQSEKAEQEAPFGNAMNEPKEPIITNNEFEQKPKRTYNRRKKDG